MSYESLRCEPLISHDSCFITFFVMKPERYRQIGELYHAALVPDAGERAAFLERACANDEDLRREVESLLSSHEQASGFLGSGALGVAAAMLSDEEGDALKGKMIGRYR